MTSRHGRSRSHSRSGAKNEAAFSTALQEFSETFKLEKAKDKPILLPYELLDSIKELLRAHGARRGNRTSFQAHLVSRIISQLDDDVCARVQLPVYNTLLKLFLQTTKCHDIERGLYLLAATLYRDSNSSSSPLKDQYMKTVNAEIGKDNMHQLLDFFTDADNPVEHRRWAGILLRQLFHGSDKNILALELEAEKTRRGLGDMLSTETHDCLIIICGQVIKELVDADAEYPRKDLWPADAKSKLYEGFPDSSQAGRWNQLFQNYVNDLTSQELDTTVYFAQNVNTKPAQHLERPGHNTNIIIDHETMTIWSPAAGSNFDQFLDIPLQDITMMIITTTEASQVPKTEARIDLCLKTNEEDFCCILNTRRVALDQVTMVMRMDDADIMKKDLSNTCQDLKIQEINSTSQEVWGACGQDLDSQMSHQSTADSLVVLREGKEVTFETTLSSSQKVIEKRAEALREPADEEDSADHLEIGEPREFLKSCTSSQDRQFENPETSKLQPSNTSQKHGASAQKPKAHAAPVLNQKARCSAGKEASGIRSPTPKTNVYETRQKTKTAEPLKKAELSVFEQSVQSLVLSFPSHRSDTLRGVLVTTDGNLELARGQLLNGGQSEKSAGMDTGSEPRIDEIENLRKAEEQFDSASFTSPDPIDAWTPKVIGLVTGKANARPSKIASTKVATKTQQANPGPSKVNSKSYQKQTPKYSLKPKASLPVSKPRRAPGKSKEKLQSAGKTNVVDKSKRIEDTAQQPKIAEKQEATLQKLAPSSDVYDLNATDEEDDSDVPVCAATSKSVQKVAQKVGKVPAKKPTATMAKSGKLAKGGQKRQSAPRKLQTIVAAARPKRGAAEKASQIIHDTYLSADEVDEAESPIEVRHPKDAGKEQNSTSQHTLQPAPKKTSYDVQDIPTSPDKNSENPLDNQETDTNGLAPLNESSVGAEPVPEINPSQERPTKKGFAQVLSTSQANIAAGVKKKSQSAKQFSSKLTDILGDIDDGLSSECEENPTDTSQAYAIPTPTRNTDSYRTPGYNSYQKTKISTTMGVSDVQASTPADKITAKYPDQRVTIVAGNETAVKDVASNGSAANVTRPHDDTNISSGQNPADTPTRGAVSHKKQTQQEMAAAHEQAAVNGNLKQSIPNGSQSAEDGVLSEVVGKRKAIDETATSVKRRRAGVEDTQTTTETSTRQSQRLKLQAKEAAQTLSDSHSETLVDDRIARKVQLVNFGASGALNQGPSSMLGSSAIKHPEHELIKTAKSPAGKKMKRTRDDVDGTNVGIPILGHHKKRQNVSQEDIQDDLLTNHANCVGSLSSPPIQHLRRRRGSKLSSQASRVDPNGSPRALVSAEKVDHFSKVSQKLSQDALEAEDQQKRQALHKSQIFGPKPRLASIPKTEPSSPQNMEPRYVKHRIGNDRYEDVETKEVIIPEKPHVDPFVGGRGQLSSGFTSRLQAGAIENVQPGSAHEPQKCISSSTQVVDQATSNAACKSSKSFTPNSGLPQKDNRVSIYDEQTTLVNFEAQTPSSPDSLTSDSSIDGEESSPMIEHSNAWNVALRPHYAKLFAVAQRLHNEVFILLANEEEVMELLVTQYRENGGILLTHMNGKRDDEKVQIVANLEKQKKEMLSVYSEAKTFVNDCENELNSSNLPKFEKQWRREQDDIQRWIEEGRNAC